MPRRVKLPAVRTGPSRRWYVVALGLWIIGWVLLFVGPYSARLDHAAAAAGNARATVEDPMRVTLDTASGGAHVLWLEVPRVRPAQDIVFQPPSARQVEISIDGETEPVAVRQTSQGDYAAAVDGLPVWGLALAEADLEPGTYTITMRPNGVPEPMRAAIGPPPESGASGQVMLAGGGLAVLSLVVGLLTRRARRRVDRGIARELRAAHGS